MIRHRLNEALKEALKAKRRRVVSTLRLILAALKDRDIAARMKGNTEGVPDEELLGLLQTMIRQRRESILLYEQGGRLDLAEAEAEEITVIENFLPEQMDDIAIREAIANTIVRIDATGLKDIGRTMAELRNTYPGRMDFAKASSLVKQALS
jgi:uncharacterized protein YqeY